jgi:hypothetical protein
VNRHVDRVFNPDHKDHHWGKRKLAQAILIILASGSVYTGTEFGTSWTGPLPPLQIAPNHVFVVALRPRSKIGLGVSEPQKLNQKRQPKRDSTASILRMPKGSVPGDKDAASPFFGRGQARRAGRACLPYEARPE